MPSIKKSLYYLGWLIIAIILLHFGNSLIDYYSERASRTFDITGRIWIWTIVPFVYGLHLGFLDGAPKSIKVNIPQLILIVIPSFLLLIYPVTTLYIGTGIKGLFVFATNHQNNLIFGLVCGMTLIKSLTRR